MMQKEEEKITNDAKPKAEPNAMFMINHHQKEDQLKRKVDAKLRNAKTA